jgi:hypothetical protein
MFIWSGTEMAYRWTMDDVRNTPAWQQMQQQARKDLGPGATAYAVPPAITKTKRPKYNNRKVTDAEGNVHDSGEEYRRWQVLELRERAGEIRSLRRQVPYALVVNGVLVCSYVADVVYIEGEATIVEDCKSPPTRKLPAYRIKVKLMQAIHGIQIREVTK